MKVNKTGPTFPLSCQPIRNKNANSLFKGNISCQSLRNENLSIRDRQLAETNKAIDTMNKADNRDKFNIILALLSGIGIGVLGTIIHKYK